MRGVEIEDAVVCRGVDVEEEPLQDVRIVGSLWARIGGCQRGEELCGVGRVELLAGPASVHAAVSSPARAAVTRAESAGSRWSKDAWPATATARTIRLGSHGSQITMPQSRHRHRQGLR